MAVMYLGRVVEQGPRRALYENPRHPYTRSLLSAAPTPKPDGHRTRIVLPGEVPSPINPPAGCPFHPRCFLSQQLAKAADAGQTVPITTGGRRVHVMQKCVGEVPAFTPTRRLRSFLTI